MAFMNGLLIFIGWIFNDLQRLYRVALGKYTNFVIKNTFSVLIMLVVLCPVVKGGFKLSFYGGLKLYDLGGLRTDRC